ncbi:EAL domain-containing protein [Gallaecimonas sp. GXIMD1310]|uniref:EAL domain-containing protein n=1 Tax=Gallaecimonas sp. GXIMD1310 TaxID=3131926 RepID=UPI0032551B3A
MHQRLARYLTTALLFFCALLPLLAHADTTTDDSDYRLYKTIGKEDGLSQLSVYDIAQDNDGYFWLATPGGVERFDGVSVEPFNIKATGSFSPSNFVRRVFVDSNDTVWVGTQNSLAFKKKSSEEFKVVKFFNGFVIWSIEKNKNGGFFVSTNKGIWLIRKNEINPQKISNIKKARVIKEIEGNYLIGTYSDGLYTLNEEFKEVNSELNFGTKINKISSVDGKLIVASNKGLFIDGKKELTQDALDYSINKNYLMVATENGLYQITRKENERIEKISPDKTWRVIIGDDGRLIVGTQAKGIEIYQEKEKGIEFFRVGNEEGTKYINSISDFNGGMVLKNQSDRVFYLKDEKIKKDPFGIKKTHGLYGNEHSLIVIKENEILNYNNKKETLITKINKNKIIKAFYNKKWFFIDDNYTLLSEYNGSLKEERSLKSCDYGYPNTVLFKNNDLFIGGDGGLCHYQNDKKPEKLSRYWIKKNFSFKGHDYFITKDGKILSSAGEVKGELKKEKKESFLSIEYDKKNHMLVAATSNGIKIYQVKISNNINTSLLLTLDSRYDIPKEFVAGASAMSGSSIYFGGSNGILKINPDLLSRKNNKGEIVFSSVSLYNEKNENLSVGISNKKSISVAHYEYPLNLHLAILKYNFPERAHFQYKLSTYGARWINLENARSITLNKLESGTHYLSVRALDNGVTVATSGQYIINVKAPWWRTPTAYIVYLLILTLIIIHFLNIAKNRKHQHAKIVESEERLKLALWGSGDELWDWDIKEGNIYRSNLWDALLLPNDGVRNKGSSNNIYPKDLARVRSVINACFSGEKDEFEVAYRVKDKQQNWVWILDRGRVVQYSEKGAPVRMTGTIKNISKLKKTEEMLKLLAQSFRNISDAICICTPDFVIQEVNDSFSSIMGVSRDEAVGQVWSFALYNERFLDQVKATLDRTGRWHDEIEAKRKGGEIFPIEITIDKVYDEEKDSHSFVAVFSDISERKEKERELERLTNTDALTSLPNRSFFMSSLDALVRKKQAFALMVLDLNNFKQVNDSLGHQYGDQLLLEISERLQYVMSANHTLYRLGGDEFAVVIEQLIKLDEITRLSGILHRQLFAPFYLRGEEINITAAIGAVVYPEDGETPEHLLRNADAAMYHAKHVGGEICQFFSSSMNEQAHARLAMESRVRKALRENLFEVYYQPKADTITGQCRGAEALLRLSDGKGGYISPADFIPIAEESGLIIEVGNWVMEATCRQVHRWYEDGIFPGRIAINLSARQFRQPDLVARIDEILEQTRLPPHMLELEITEGAMMEDPIRAVAVMERLRERNITLAMDDFGTGYSSLSNLRQFPVSSVKIDRSFVKDLTIETSPRSLTAAIISLASNMELHVVAEGVETEEQWQALKALGCPVCQGYLFGRPMAQADFEKLLSKRGGLLGPAEVVTLKR